MYTVSGNETITNQNNWMKPIWKPNSIDTSQPVIVTDTLYSTNSYDTSSYYNGYPQNEFYYQNQAQLVESNESDEVTAAVSFSQSPKQQQQPEDDGGAVATAQHLKYQPTIFTTQKMNNSATKLSYTPYQLELLNSIYTDMKYPNSVQKTLIAKLIGITRDQVKIWFQNRRRKDTINAVQINPRAGPTKGLKRSFSDDNDENSNDAQDATKRSLVGNQIIEGVLNELRNHKNAPSRLSSKRTKLSASSSTTTGNDENSKPNLLTNATQILDSQVLKKTPNNCIIDLCPIINNNNNAPSAVFTSIDTANNEHTTSSSNQSSSFVTTTTTTASSSDEQSDTPSTAGYASISTNYEQKLQTLNKPHDIQSYLHKKYYSNYYYPQTQAAAAPPQLQQAWSQIDPTTYQSAYHHQTTAPATYSNEYYQNYNRDLPTYVYNHHHQQQPTTVAAYATNTAAQKYQYENANINFTPTLANTNDSSYVNPLYQY